MTVRLLRTGAIAGVVAAIATTVLAALARAADVSLEIDGRAIPVGAFAFWTLIGGALGILLARLLRDPRRFYVVGAVGTALSLVPPIATADDAATRIVLVAAHLLAAIVIVPALGRELGGFQRLAGPPSTPAS